MEGRATSAEVDPSAVPGAPPSTGRGGDRSAGLRALALELGAWAGGPGPLFRALARGVAGAIERGALARGTRLPAERALASALAVSRGTAVAAYDLLEADGLIERRRGSGTFVLGADPVGLPAGREGSALVHRLVDRGGTGGGLIDLSISVLADATGLPDVVVTSADLAGTGYDPWGLPALRGSIAAHVSGWGLPTNPAQVVVTTGAQQAIAAAAACWVRPGDVVAVDDPTYPGAVAALTSAGARLVGIRVDGGGVVPDSLREVLDRRPALVYLQSTVHSPTGTVLGAARRADVAAALAAARVPLLEDCALADLAWEPAPPPIASLLPSASTAVVGSLSKLFWGGLRLGFVRAPEPVALRFARVKATQDLGSAMLSQVVAHRLLGEADGIRRRRRDDLRSRYEVLAGALRSALPAWSWQEPGGGLSIWARLPVADAAPVAQVALRHGVAVATASPLSVGDGHRDHLRLSFAPPPEELVAGVERLAAASAEVLGR